MCHVLLMNVAEENSTLISTLRKTDETRSYFLKNTKQNDLMNTKHRKFCTVLNYIEQSLILGSAILDAFQFLI